MLFRRLALVALLVGTMSPGAIAQTTEQADPQLLVELNAVQDVEGSCQLSFLVRNETGSTIDKAVFEMVIFDAEGGVLSLSLYNFRDLPASRPRVRQFVLPGRLCASVGQALINGANECVVNGSDSDICHSALKLSSRVEMELLG